MVPSTQRFTNRVENYVKYRPSYPAEVIDTLTSRCGLQSESVVADVGAGTGIFTTLLLDAGLRVIAVEPNDAMRAAAEAAHLRNLRFTSIAGTAEDTGLDDISVDLVTAAQAFHWFRVEETGREFRRALKPGGRVALIWNQRHPTAPFQQAYVALLRKYSPDYDMMDHADAVADERLDAFFGRDGYETYLFPNQQALDLEGLKGRTSSSSYCPTPDQPGFTPLMAELEALFHEYAVDGQLAFEYETQLYLGRPVD